MIQILSNFVKEGLLFKDSAVYSDDHFAAGELTTFGKNIIESFDGKHKKKLIREQFNPKLNLDHNLPTHTIHDINHLCINRYTNPGNVTPPFEKGWY